MRRTTHTHTHTHTHTAHVHNNAEPCFFYAASGLTYEHVLAGFMKEARVINASSDDSAAAPAGSLASAAVGISSGKNSKPTTPRGNHLAPLYHFVSVSFSVSVSFC
jgi:hypothetical protein